MTNALFELSSQGQSVWLDFISRALLESGELARLIEQDGVRGVTSNPTIFAAAIEKSSDYDADIKAWVREKELGVGELFEALAVADIRRGADLLRPVFDATGGADGFISLEVSPYLAMDAAETIAEARRLWRAVGRPNLMIKVPGTEPGLAAIRTLIAEEINVNVTLLFSISAYEAVAEAYMEGLEALLSRGQTLSRVASVASFFVSRIDQSVEKLVTKRLPAASAGEASALRELIGKVAIANAKLAYQQYKRLIASPRWQRLASAGARPQRLLWASTSTKSKDLPPTYYVSALIGRDTVNTMPPETLAAVKSSMKVAPTLEEDLPAAESVMQTLERLGISLAAITEDLLREGVQRFAADADRLYAAVARRRAEALGMPVPAQRLHLPEPKLSEALATERERWRQNGLIRRVWARDAKIWTGTNEAQWLGWLDAVAQAKAALPGYEAFKEEIAAKGIRHVVLLGMGGSSLGAEVLASILPASSNAARLVVVDTTDPVEIRAAEQAIDLRHTLFVVASKSGTTLEPNLLFNYFWERVASETESPGRQFVAITDPGSALEAEARRHGFWRIFHGEPSIGGRYSVLSAFGLVCAAALGLDLSSLLALAGAMAASCGPLVPPEENPGVELGIILGVAAQRGRNKLTILASPSLAPLGAWLEQLLAESTGKQGMGIVPIVDEPEADAAAYGSDRLFVALEALAPADASLERRCEILRAAGHPVVQIPVASRLHIGAEFFRWEMATAVAGAVLGINPFDQPDVEASKQKTRTLTAEVEKEGRLSLPEPIFQEGGLALYTSPELAAKLGSHRSLADYLRAHFLQVQPGDYVALLAYLARDAAHIELLQAMRAQILRAKRVATCIGFGPRFLHSTGQLHKGGPNSGVFLQITNDDADDINIPGHRYTFGTVKTAQAFGDFAVMAERGRRIMGVHISADTQAGLNQLATVLKEAIA
ncbi:MAG: bifunctional transaldolase/phosoglucose isomerase [Acidobacteriia bacterium]|nr:bifunctional transaldolase/phosoglucose isomerase [Methyloceanibacter sp.]MCL6490910.1 bifunctional transaldolase/phosoglucose isomerase [Terriglobia bacterium]